jgi:hypothetical protein
MICLLQILFVRRDEKKLSLLAGGLQETNGIFQELSN